MLELVLRLTVHISSQLGWQSDLLVVAWNQPCGSIYITGIHNANHTPPLPELVGNHLPDHHQLSFQHGARSYYHRAQQSRALRDKNKETSLASLATVLSMGEEVYPGSRCLDAGKMGDGHLDKWPGSPRPNHSHSACRESQKGLFEPPNCPRESFSQNRILQVNQLIPFPHSTLKL